MRPMGHGPHPTPTLSNQSRATSPANAPVEKLLQLRAVQDGRQRARAAGRRGRHQGVQRAVVHAGDGGGGAQQQGDALGLVRGAGDPVAAFRGEYGGGGVMLVRRGRERTIVDGT